MIPEKDFAGRQARGARGHQEDAYAFTDISSTDGSHREEGLLAVIADGMGGHTSGERASELALESFIDAFHEAGGTLRERLKNAAVAANDALAEELKRQPELEGMGTTLLAVGVTKNGAEWVSVGDSPLYLWSRNKLTRLNEDHSFRPVLQEMLALGKITPPEMARHPFRNLLRAAITGAEIELIDLSEEPVALHEGDMILAATDGIQTLSDDAIAAILAKASMANDAFVLASGLVQGVLAAGHPKQDNTTVAIIKTGPEGFVAHAPEAEKDSKPHTETVVMNPLLKQKQAGERGILTGENGGN
ncbi:MAG: protein phosphatase 2C domain-containing protein [Chthoniobacteraceae bacterium]